MMLVLASAAVAFMAPPGKGAPVPEDFDLSRASGRAVSREQASPSAPVLPADMDTRDFAVDPEVQWPLAENGPVILLGAMGGKHGDAYRGMPKLAHVALGWSF